MYGVASTTNTLATTFTGTGEIIAMALGVLLIGIAALLGLGFGVRKLIGYIFNEPGSIGYNSQYGSGWSRFNHAKMEGEEGGHMRAIEF